MASPTDFATVGLWHWLKWQKYRKKVITVYNTRFIFFVQVESLSALEESNELPRNASGFELKNI